MNTHFRKSILAGLLCVVISFSSLAQAGTYSGGEGTAAKPYKIATLADWLELIESQGDWDKHFVLLNDIDFAGATITPVAPDTNASPSGFQGTSFTGVLDGNGHTVSNFVINQPAHHYVGLFGYIGSNGQILRLGVEPFQVTGGSYVGGLCGQNYGAISTSYATGGVSGTGDYVGGLCGYNDYGTISTSYATGSVSGTGSYVGGLCGYNYSTITSCYATGSVSGTQDVGGLCGYNSHGSITSCYATGGVSGTGSYVGGLVGVNDYSSTISASYATGSVSGYDNVGGLCGYSYGTMIKTSFWDVQTSGQTTSDNGTGKTTAEMQDINTFLEAGWDFAVNDDTPAVWYMPEGDYPGLTCQFSVEVADVTGLPLSEVAPSLLGLWPGLNVVFSVEASDTVAEGHVIRQTPSPGSVMPGTSVVDVIIAGKPGGYRGSGTTEDPYQIDTPSDWLWLVQTPSDWDKQFVLIADLDFGMAPITPVAPDTNASPSGFQGTSFTGVLDGNGHTVSNFVINQPAHHYVGLFGYIGSNGQILRLGVEPFQVTGGSYVGGLCGYNDSGTISTSYATGTVSGSGYHVGGLCGRNYDGSITSSYATGSVSGTGDYVGGLCGQNYDGSITSSYATGSVSGTGDYVGGLCGENYYGSITSSYATGAVNGTSHVGGLVGHNWYGSLVGFNTVSAINACYATGTVSGSSRVGGLVGWNDNGTISACYATGAVSGTGDVGGLVGYGGGTIIASFWDIQTSGQTGSARGKGLTTAQMKTMSIYQNAGWSEKGWVMNDGVDYPRLDWENTSGTSIPLPLAIPLTGNGTAEDPYLISTAEEFALLSWYSDILNKHIRLTNNLDLSGVTLYPIGDLGRFTGVFNGSDCTVSTAVILQPNCGFVGLFSYLGSGGQIRNLGAENIDITGGGIVGGLVGYNYDGTITACYATGTVSGTSSVGGLVGSNSGAISTSYATGSVSGTGSYVGGLCGNNASSGSITSSYATGSVSGTQDVGGLCGYNSYGSITSCYATGGVNGTGTSRVGGLCGYNYYSSIRSSYATGSVSGTGSFVGGLCGYNQYATISTSFWDVQTSGQTTSNGGIGLTTAEMQTLSTFTSAGWDFTNETLNGTNDIWRMCIDGVDYPRLNWEFINGEFTCPDGVNTEDLNHYVGYWLMNNCTIENNYCGGADLNYSGVVDLADWAIFAENWLIGI